MAIFADLVDYILYDGDSMGFKLTHGIENINLSTSSTRMLDSPTISLGILGL